MSGYAEGTLFPWVVSDFSLIDSIEAGIVKVPRVPVADDSMMGEQPTYRDLWLRIREDLPKKGRKTEAVDGEPKLPLELQGALHSLYSNYEKNYRLWEQNAETRDRGITPPVFIVVCNNTNVSKLVFDYIAGWEKSIGDRTVVQAGQLPIFRNDDGNGGWLRRPNTILVDSQQLESGEAMSDDFKQIAAREIDEFKAEYRVRFPGRDAEALTDEDLLREVMNTVGKADKLGEQVRCVVSVSMLTEGWDANNVTQIIGLRAFTSQLLCEQVVGRALRRRSYDVDENGFLRPENADVYGVPFQVIPVKARAAGPVTERPSTLVQSLKERSHLELRFPRVEGYVTEVAERVVCDWRSVPELHVGAESEPTEVLVKGAVGVRIGRPDRGGPGRLEVQNRLPYYLLTRVQSVTFAMEKYFRDDDGNDKPWLFPQVLAITKRWLAEYVTFKDHLPTSCSC